MVKMIPADFLALSYRQMGYDRKSAIKFLTYLSDHALRDFPWFEAVVETEP